MRNKKINYRKEAFLHPWNLTFMIGAMGAALAVGWFVQGSLGANLFNSMMIFAAGAELLILGTVPGQKRFRDMVKARKAKEHAKPPTSREIYSELTRENQRRYEKLRVVQKRIEANYQKFSYASQGLLESHLSKIDDLLSSFLTMMQQKERFGLYASSVQEREVVRDMAQLRTEMKGASDHVRRIKLRRYKVLEQRLVRFKKTQERLEILNEQIETIEDVVDYIHEQSMTLQNPEQISLQLDVLLSDVEETEASVGEIESAFGDSSLTWLDEFDDLTGGAPGLDSSGLDDTPHDPLRGPRSRDRS